MGILDPQQLASALEGGSQGPEAPLSPPEAEADERSGVGRVLSETTRAVAGGVRDGFQELGNTIQWAGEGIGNAITGGNDLYITDNGLEWLSADEAAAADNIIFGDRNLLGDEGIIDLPDVQENETAAGALGRGVVQFLAGYGALSRVARGARVLQGSNTLTRGMTLGAGTDFAAFDAHEDRLADFLQDHFEVRNVVVDWLASDEDDSVLEGRLNNVVEGAILGAATEGVVALVSLFRRARQVQAEQGDEAAAEVMNDGLAEIAETRPEVLEPSARPAADEAVDPEAAAPRETPDTDAPAQAEVRTDEPEIDTSPVNTQAFEDGLDELMNLRTTNPGGFMRNPDDPVAGNLLNFRNMDVESDILDVWNAGTEAVVARGIQQETTFAQIAEDASRWTADYLEVSPGVVQRSLARMAEDAQRQQGLIVAGKEIALSLSREIERLAMNIHVGRATDEERAAFLRRSEELVQMTASLKSVIRGAAQTTAAGRIATRDVVTGEQIDDALMGTRLNELLEGRGPDINRLASAVVAGNRRGAGAGATRKIVEAGRETLLGRGMDVINEVFINSILSGPKTHMINMISNTINGIWLPAERSLGAAMAGDMGTAREALRMYAGMRIALADSIAAMGTALRTGDNILDPQGAILEANGIADRAIRSESENPIVRGMINGLGEFIRIPGRLLSASDEFFKQMGYRSSVYSRLMTEAYDRVQAGTLRRDNVAEWVSNRMNQSFDGSGRAVSDTDLQFAREVTFTQDLRPGTLPQMVQNTTNRAPALKLILPFVRTPTNILKAAFQRTPGLHLVSRQMREDLASGDPRRVAAARGKLATGAALWSAGAFAAMEGTITGSGPQDPQVRARLMETGWRPYSVRVPREDGTIEYIEYRRLEPFAMIFGTIADIVAISGEVDQMRGEELVAAGMTALVNNVASKTFLQGIVDAVEAFNDPNRYMGSFMRNYASAMVPHSAALREIRRQNDPVMRDVRTMLDAVRNTVPGYSTQVPTRFSWITGQPFVYPSGYGSQMSGPVGDAMASINPVIHGFEEPDVVLRELASLGHGFSPPPRTLQGVDLTPQQYSRLLELHGTVRLNGRRTLYQSLERMFTSAGYDLERRRVLDPEDSSLSDRVRAVQGVITGYRRAARAQLLEEFPELRDAIIQRQIEGRGQRVEERTQLGTLADLADGRL